MNIKEVAEKAGVSITTVSRVLNKPELVSEDTKTLVLQVMKELNYTPNWFARNLQNKRTHVVGMLIPDMMNPSNMELAKGVEKIVRQKGCNVILCNTEYDVDLEREHVETLINRKVDGLIMIESLLEMDELKVLNEKQVPFVLVDRTDCLGEENTVYTDYEDAAEKAIRHLLDMGRRRIAIVLPDKSIAVNIAKYNGYKHALGKSNIEVDDRIVMYSENSFQGGMVAASKLLESDNPPDAIFGTTDTLAIGILDRLRQSGITSESIGVIGFDDLDISGIIEPKLTTVDKPSYRMGLTAARVLFDEIEEEDASGSQSVMLESRLKIRKSCGNKERLREIW